MLFSVKMNFVPLFYDPIIRWLSKQKTKKKTHTHTRGKKKKHTAENTTHIVSARRDQG